MSRSTSPLLRLIALVTLNCAVVANVANAQADRPVVFVHGLSSSGQTWGMAAYLQGIYRLQPKLPNLPDNGHATYGAQAVALQTFLNSDTSDVIAVAHSNGGIVSRVARQNGLNVRSITTIGTPHQGAALAQNVLNGRLGMWGGAMFSALGSPWAYAPVSWWSPVRFLLNLFKAVSLLWQATVQLGVQIFTSSWAVLQELTPGSTFHVYGLGTADIHGVPESAIPNRVSIQVSAPDPSTGIFFAGTMPTHRTAGIASRTAMIAIYVMFSQYYSSAASSTNDMGRRWQLASSSASFANGATALLTMDRNWCDFIGAANGPFTTALGGCAPSDGIVPLAAQYWPGATSITTSALGHSAETSSTSIAAIVGASSFDLNSTVPRR